MQINLTRKLTVALLAILCTLLWGSVFPIIKICYGELGITSADTSGQILFAGSRYLGAGLIVLAITAGPMKMRLRLTKKTGIDLFLFGLLQTTLVNSLFYIGIANTSGMKAALLMALPTFFTVIMSPFFFKNDGLNWQKVLGLAGGFLGIFLVNLGKDLSLSFAIMGEGVLIIVGFGSGLCSILSKILSRELHPFLLAGYQQVFGASLMVLYGLIGGGLSNMKFSWLGIAFTVYLAGTTALSTALWTALLKHNKPSHVAIFGFGTPVFGSVLSAVFLPDEFLSLNIVCAMALIAFSVILVNSEQGKIRRAIPVERSL